MARILIALILSVQLAAALAASERRIALADRGFMTLTIPDGWVDEVRQPDPRLPPTISIRPESGPPFEILVTPIWPVRDDGPKPTLEAIRAAVRVAAEAAKSQSVEQEIAVRDFSGPETFGAYYSATDRAPKPGEYKFLTQGMLGLADLRVTFTILTNDGQQKVAPQALEMLKGARRGTGEKRVRRPQAFSIHVAGARWSD